MGIDACMHAQQELTQFDRKTVEMATLAVYIRFFSARILKVGEYFLKIGFKALLHTRLMCRFCGDPLRDG